MFPEIENRLKQLNDDLDNGVPNSSILKDDQQQLLNAVFDIAGKRNVIVVLFCVVNHILIIFVSQTTCKYYNS
jgi:hypothetical protein